MKFIETGLINRLDRKFRNNNYKCWSEPVKIVGMEKFASLFVFYGLMCVLSLIILFVEMLLSQPIKNQAHSEKNRLLERIRKFCDFANSFDMENNGILKESLELLEESALMLKQP